MKNTIGSVFGKVSSIFCALLIVATFTGNIAMAGNDKGIDNANEHGNGNAYGQEKKEERAKTPDKPDNNPSQHPSENDRNTEKGKSGTQGNSKSNPDGGGTDKRQNAKDGALAGTQGSGDFDNNNGCGNDNDFEDDNNGNCGGKTKSAKTQKPKNEASPDPDPSPKDEHPKKETICHATGSASNPYVEITISEDGVENGHNKHADDKIPAPQKGCPKPNAGGSTNPDPSPSPTPTASSSANSGGNTESSSNTASATSTVLGAISKLPETGLNLLMYAWILALLPIGVKMALYKKKQLLVTQVLSGQS